MKNKKRDIKNDKKDIKEKSNKKDGIKYKIILKERDENNRRIEIECDAYIPWWYVNSNTGHTEFMFLTVDFKTNVPIFIPYHEVWLVEHSDGGKEILGDVNNYNKKMLSLIMESIEKDKKAKDMSKNDVSVG